MSENADKVVKNTLFLSIANTLPRITQAVVIFIAARALGDVGLGKYYTIASVVALTNLFTDLGLSASFTKELSTHKDEVSKYFFNILLVKIFLGFFSYAALIFITYLLDYPQDILKSAYLYGIYMSVWAITGLFLSVFQAFEEMAYNAFIWGLSAFINLAVSLFLLFSHPTFLSPIWGLTIGGLFSLILGIILISKKVHFSFSYFDKPFLIKNLKLAFPFALNSIFSSIYFRLGSIILSKLESEQVMGWYGASFKLLDNLLMLPNFFLGAVYPTLCRIVKDSREKFTWVFSESLKVIAVGGFPISFGLYITAPKIILFLYGPEFINGTLSLKILSFALLAIFFTSFGVVSLMVLGKMKLVNLVGIFNILLNAGICFLLIPSWGMGWSLNGAAFATLACELFGLLAFMIYFIKRKLFRRNLLQDIGKPFLASLVMSFAVYLSLSLNLFFNILIGGLVYFLVLWLLKGFEDREIELIKNLFRRK